MTLAVLDGDFYFMDLMTIMIMPIGLTLMLGSVIGAPIYMISAEKATLNFKFCET